MAFLFLFCLSVGISSAEPLLDSWNYSGDIKEDLSLNPIRFTNRAQCAADSNSPTKSAFVMIDSINPGKAFYRLSKMTGGDVEVETKKGIEKFRYTTLELIKIISKKLLTGKLPLLKADLKKYSGNKVFEYFKSCNEGDCYDLNNHIKKLWNKSKNDLVSNEGFNQNDFLHLNHDQLKHNDARLSCYYVKKFSSLQGHLFAPWPTATSATRLGETMTKHDEYVTECSNIKAQKNLKVANYQIDILDVTDYNWNQRGFDFWNSLKIYLTWAFRYSNEASELAYPYWEVLKSVALEENVLFIPNGCKSINAPKCDSASLNLNSMRNFAKMSEQDVFKSDFTAQVAEGVEQDVLNQPIVDVNNDILNFAKTHDADSWALNFRKKFTKTRGILKLKFINAINKLKLIKGNLNSLTIKKELNVSKEKSDKIDLLKSEIYYMCSEFKVATDEQLSFLQDEVSLLNNKTILDRHSKVLGGESVKDYIKYFKQITSEVTNFCNTLSKEGFWKDGYEIDRDGFSSWYKEVTRNKNVPFKTNITRKLSKEVTPLLAFNKPNRKARPSEVVCVDGANCARVILESVIDLYSSLKYADSLLPAQTVKDPALLNPYNERKSCQVYDPFRKKRLTIFKFFYDIARAATFGFLPSPVYISTEIKDKQVVSLKTLMDEGKVTFDPQIDGVKMKHSLTADLGALIGIPCAISISGSRYNAARYYRFNGVSVGACTSTTVNNLVVSSSTNMSSSSSERSKCASCAINLETIVGAAASIEPVTRAAYILARGVWNLVKGLRDPHDIPRRWTMNLNDTHHTYRKYGKVNEYCLKKILQGKSCLKNSCEGAMVRSAGYFFKGGVEKSFAGKYRGNGFLKLSSCDEPIEVKLGRNRGRICRPLSGMIESDFIVPESCNIRKNNHE